MAKLPVGMIAMKKVEKGEWTMDKQFTMLPEDPDLVHNPEAKQQIGNSFTLEFLLDKMLLESDNTSYKMLVRELTEDELVSIAEEVGLEQFFTVDGKVSAKDYTRLFRSLYLATYLDEEHSQQLLELLQRSEFKDFIKAGIPADVPFAHKWGINDARNVYGDAGIVYAKDRPFMLAVMIEGKHGNAEDQAKAEALIKEIGEHAYNYVINYQRK
jgi:beta-lactamase class A